MNMKIDLEFIAKGVAILGLAIFLFMPSETSAHPGNTAADGCHYCRTNCSSWGVPWNVRHCHNSYSTPTYRAPTYSTPTPVKTYTFEGQTYYSYSAYQQAKDDWIERHKEGVKTLYKTILEREPTQAEVDYWADKESDINKIKLEFLASDEYKVLQAKKTEKQKEKDKQIAGTATDNGNSANNDPDSSWVWWLLAGGGTFALGNWVYKQTKKK